MSNTIISDDVGNIFTVENFIYNLNNELIKVINAKIKDYENNNYQINKAIIDLVSNKIIGKDVNIDFDNKSFQKDNEPRLNGKSIKSDGSESVITNGVFTTCKETDSCPPWHLTAKEIKHDKEKKIIYYKDAWLKIYDTPVVYFPKFFHPDPSVKRQSGFLMPSFQGSSSIGDSFNTPYFHVLAKNKDATIKPRFFSNSKLLLQTEYREINKDSSSIFDFSFLNENHKAHLFANFKNEIKNSFSPKKLQFLLMIAGIGCCVAMAMPQVHIVALCVDSGFGLNVGAEVLAVMLFSGMISRIASGVLSDKIGPVLTLFIGSLLQMISLVFFLPFDSQNSLYIVSFMFGLSQGGIVPAYACLLYTSPSPRD